MGQGTKMTFGSDRAFCNSGFLRAASGTGELLGRERRKARPASDALFCSAHGLQAVYASLGLVPMCLSLYLEQVLIPVACL